jgi:DNA repair protein RadC
MKYPKLTSGETTDAYALESMLTEADVLQIAQQLAMFRLTKGRALTERRLVFSHLQTLLQFHDYDVLALLLLDTEHKVIGFRELFRGALKDACVSPREVVKIALEHNAASVILVQNYLPGDPESSQANRLLNATLKNALNLIGTHILDHVVVAFEGCVSLAEQRQL